MGWVGGGGEKYRGGGMIAGYSVQVNIAVIVVIWDQELGDYGYHVKSTRGIPSLEARRIAGMTEQRMMIRGSECTLVDDALETAGRFPIK